MSSDAALLGLSFAAAVAGMGGFALANDQHWRQLLGTRAQTRPLRAACIASGAALLGLSFLLCAIVDPLSMAVLVWPMLLGVAAGTVAAFLTFQGRKSGRL